MKLIPKELIQIIPKLYETENQKDPLVYCKLFTPDANWTWFITELSIDYDTCFGYVISPFESELGYFSLSEIEEVKESLGLKVQRDLSFKLTTLSKIKK